MYERWREWYTGYICTRSAVNLCAHFRLNIFQLTKTKLYHYISNCKATILCPASYSSQKIENKNANKNERSHTEAAKHKLDLIESALYSLV